MPLGFMPLLEVDGKPLSQSMAINRLLARRFGMFLRCNLNAKGKSEDLIPRMTDNTIMAKRKRTKEQTTKHYTEN
jgi:glutathione S-transferase